MSPNTLQPKLQPVMKICQSFHNDTLSLVVGNFGMTRKLWRYVTGKVCTMYKGHFPVTCYFALKLREFYEYINS